MVEPSEVGADNEYPAQALGYDILVKPQFDCMKIDRQDCLSARPGRKNRAICFAPRVKHEAAEANGLLYTYVGTLGDYDLSIIDYFSN